MNPGKKVNAPPMTENLRFGPSIGRRAEDLSRFQRRGGFARAVEMCNGRASAAS